MERSQEKRETEGSAPKRRLLKKNLESPRRWNGDKTSSTQQAVPRKGTIKKKKQRVN